MEAKLFIHIQDANETLISEVVSLLNSRLEKHTATQRPHIRVQKDESFSIEKKEGVK
jgi:hypothetical protein